ncbi:MAG: AAA family ATPase [Nitrosarchaeum sp.]|nr:AAA family ATPase [Nitrosarchaeum sp.]
MELTRKKISEIRKKIEKKNSVFAEKRYLDSMIMPSKIIGREAQTEKLLSYIMSLRDGFVVPFVSVYGRSGSGKSTVVKFVCENLLDLISFRFVNLRKARTVFGCANMILGNLNGESLSSAQGLNKAVDCIQSQIEDILEREEKKYFVLVLDEYDVIFSDSRGNPSDFVYKLLQMEENLRERGLWVCIITISNNALYEYELDDRVKSRMGSDEIHFTPYSENNVFGILYDRAKKAFKIKLDSDVLNHCAKLASSDHGDARRALDLLRVAGEICDGIIKKDDVIKAQKIIQKDRVDEIIANASYHMRCVVGAIVSLAIVKEESWSATSNIFKKYTEIVSKDHNPLKYRRISDLLVELENTGILVSRDYSRGRGGYGKEFKLKVDPGVVGPSVSKEFYDSQVKRRAEVNRLKEYQKLLKSRGRFNIANRYARLLKDF